MRPFFCALIALSVTLACAGADPPKEPACTATLPAECPSPMPLYADVEPIIHSRCVGCHSDTSTGPWPLTSYTDIVDWSDLVRKDVLNCSMPPRDSGVRMTAAETKTMLDWISCELPR